MHMCMMFSNPSSKVSKYPMFSALVQIADISDERCEG